jgi:glycosyltransferase involved in cell wall biosynthesis
VRDGRNGFVVPAGDAAALATRLRALAADDSLRELLGAAAREDAADYTPAAWAAGMGRALAAAGAGRGSGGGDC